MTCFQASVGKLARFGYSLTASPLKYGVRSAHFDFKNVGSWGMTELVAMYRMSGSSLPAMSVGSVTVRLTLVPAVGFCTAAAVGAPAGGVGAGASALVGLEGAEVGLVDAAVGEVVVTAGAHASTSATPVIAIPAVAS